MTAPSGINGSIGYGEESTYGTGVTPTEFLPLIDESLTRTPVREKASPIRPDRLTADSEDWGDFGRTAAGSVGHLLYPVGIEVLMEHCFGAVAESGAGPYVRTYTPGFLTGKALTAEVGLPQTDGTVRRKRLLGGKVSSWELGFAAGEYVTYGIDLVGKDLDVDDTAITTVALPTGLAAFRATQAGITYDGAALKVRSGTIGGENAMNTDRWHLGEETIDEPLDNDRRVYSGEIVVEFRNLDLYDDMSAGTEVPLVVTCTSGTNTFVPTLNIKLLEGTPVVESRDVLVVTYPYEAVGDGSDADAITAVLTNDVAFA